MIKIMANPIFPIFFLVVILIALLSLVNENHDELVACSIGVYLRPLSDSLKDSPSHHQQHIGRQKAQKTANSHRKKMMKTSCNPGKPIKFSGWRENKSFYVALVSIDGVILSIIFIIAYKKKLAILIRASIFFLLNRRKDDQKNVKVFLKNYQLPGPKRFKYSEIKKMTNTFREKLGQGGYGSVFKGKLGDGRPVAVKILGKSKGNGEDFINEVATIGSTNHVNIVTLLGFCSEGSKRALVYEFMLNGSLDKSIFTKKSMVKSQLSMDILYQISLGVARGLEYLHQGCGTRIVHLDIKPHNILLDQEMCPKISDFGLAKLCATRERFDSMNGPRGTVGYMAPELYRTNLGGMSDKSDVYSYGMMLLEMVGGRRNLDLEVENSSQIYFPHWIYKHQLKQREDVTSVPEIVEEVGELEYVKKMIMVGTWCIQIDPTFRPSMSKVVEMLEGRVELLQFPPNPFSESSLGVSASP